MSNSFCRTPLRASRLTLAVFVVLAGLVRVGATAQVPDTAQAPDVVVRSAIRAVLAIIEHHRESFETDPKGYYQAVDDTMAGYIDYPAIARGVMANYWAEASPEQRERFVEIFRQGLVRTYGRTVLEFEQGRVEVLPLRDDHVRDTRAFVDVKITDSNGHIYPFQYSMGKGADGEWRIRNVIVDGINLGLAYRNQFASAMQKGKARSDMDTVIDNWLPGRAAPTRE